jgi:hypothetical protein
MTSARFPLDGAAFLLFFLLLVVAASDGTAVSAADRTKPVPCNIQRGACSADLGNRLTAQFDIQPRPVTAMSELTFVVTLLQDSRQVIDAAVSLDLSMPGMYMGKNSPVLKHIANGRYEGKGLIPRCMSGSRTWQADLAVVRGQQKGSASFLIEVP